MLPARASCGGQIQISARGIAGLWHYYMDVLVEINAGAPKYSTYPTPTQPSPSPTPFPSTPSPSVGLEELPPPAPNVAQALPSVVPPLA